MNHSSFGDLGRYFRWSEGTRKRKAGEIPLELYLIIITAPICEGSCREAAPSRRCRRPTARRTSTPSPCPCRTTSTHLRTTRRSSGQHTMQSFSSIFLNFYVCVYTERMYINNSFLCRLSGRVSCKPGFVSV